MNEEEVFSKENLGPLKSVYGENTTPQLKKTLPKMKSDRKSKVNVFHEEENEIEKLKQRCSEAEERTEEWKKKYKSQTDNFRQNFDNFKILRSENQRLVQLLEVQSKKVEVKEDSKVFENLENIEKIGKLNLENEELKKEIELTNEILEKALHQCEQVENSFQFNLNSTFKKVFQWRDTFEKEKQAEMKKFKEIEKNLLKENEKLKMEMERKEEELNLQREYFESQRMDESLEFKNRMEVKEFTHEIMFNLLRKDEEKNENRNQEMKRMEKEVSEFTNILTRKILFMEKQHEEYLKIEIHLKEMHKRYSELKEFSCLENKISKEEIQHLNEMNILLRNELKENKEGNEMKWKEMKQLLFQEYQQEYQKMTQEYEKKSSEMKQEFEFQWNQRVESMRQHEEINRRDHQVELEKKNEEYQKMTQEYELKWNQRKLDFDSTWNQREQDYESRWDQMKLQHESILNQREQEHQETRKEFEWKYSEMKQEWEGKFNEMKLDHEKKMKEQKEQKEELQRQLYQKKQEMKEMENQFHQYSAPLKQKIQQICQFNRIDTSHVNTNQQLDLILKNIFHLKDQQVKLLDVMENMKKKIEELEEKGNMERREYEVSLMKSLKENEEMERLHSECIMRLKEFQQVYHQEEEEEEISILMDDEKNELNFEIMSLMKEKKELELRLDILLLDKYQHLSSPTLMLENETLKRKLNEMEHRNEMMNKEKELMRNEWIELKKKMKVYQKDVIEKYKNLKLQHQESQVQIEWMSHILFKTQKIIEKYSMDPLCRDVSNLLK
jgi:hypothetical protein